MMVTNKQKSKTQSRRQKKCEMLTPDGELIRVPEKKVQVKLMWGWTLVSEENNKNTELRR